MARICIVYDCVYPWTVGGAERWLTAVARYAATAGHTVTYITRVQWDAHERPAIDGVEVIGVSPNDTLYRADGSRTLRAPVRFGIGVHRFLRERRYEFDLIHTHAFPFFGALGAARALRGTGIPIVVDWAEIWPREYWISYAGGVAGRAGWMMQRRTARIPQHALVPSQLHAQRLRDLGVRGDVTVLTGQYDGEIEPAPRAALAPPTVVFAGRHIPEKGVAAIPDAIAMARGRQPDLRCLILGDGPERSAVLRRVDELGLSEAIDVPGFVTADEVNEAIGSAVCLLLPSRREGYGLVVVEAAARGTPAIVIAAPDNASTELIDEGRNGFIAASASAEDLAQSILACVDGGCELRASTSRWANARGETLTTRGSMRQVIGVYDALLARRGMRPTAS